MKSAQYFSCTTHILEMMFGLLFVFSLIIQCSKAFNDRKLSGIIGNETALCQSVRRHLFYSTKNVDQQRFEWERYLPVFMKTSLSGYPGVKVGQHESEVEFPYGHLRFNLLGPTGPRCRTSIESYGKGDEEKRACGLQQLQTLNQVNVAGEKNQDCVVYSIGSNNQWGFEEDIIAKTHCRIETFDCTIGKDIQPPAKIRHRVRFHPVCLSDSDYVLDGRQYLSWTSLNKLTGITTSPTFIKMDIEGYEFPVLRSIIDAGNFLPLQIAVEIHYIRFENGKPDYRLVNSLELYSFFNYLYKYGGYYLIDRNDNPYCKHCTEIVLAKLNCHNYPRPSNYQEILLSSDAVQTPLFTKELQSSFQKKYYN